MNKMNITHQTQKNKWKGDIIERRERDNAQSQRRRERRDKEAKGKEANPLRR